MNHIQSKVEDLNCSDASPTEGSECTPNASNSLAQRLNSIDPTEMASQFSVGKMLMEDIIKTLCRPGRDPRESLPPPIFRSGILDIEDLSVGMNLKGQVLNVVDFGVFVDIGLGESGLVHISNLSSNYIRDPHEHFCVGDVLDVWVATIDKKRRRVSLTAIDPSLPKPKKVHQRSTKPPARAGKSNESGNAISDRQDSMLQGDSSAQGLGGSGQHSSESKGRRGSGNGQNVRTGGQGHGGQGHGGQGGQVAANQKNRGDSDGRPRHSSARNAAHYQKGRSANASGNQSNRRRYAGPVTPPKPITEEMARGQEPLRSFSDLMQFVKQPDKDSDQ